MTRLSDGRHRIRGTYTDPRTGLRGEIDRRISAPTASAARTRLDELVDEARAGARPQRVRLSEYADSWLARKKPSLEPTTLDRYGRAILLHILPALGELFLDSVQAADVVRWRDRLAAKMKPASTNSNLRVLKTILADAASELRLHDPAARVAQVSEARARDELGANVLSGEQLRQVLDELRSSSPDLYACALTLAFTGLRWSEVSALRWSSVDFDLGTIVVDRKQWRGHVGPPKTGTRRTVPLVEALADALRAHRARLEDEGELAEVVFAGSRGARFRSRTWFAKPLAAAIARAKVDARCTPHGLRHTWNDLLRRVAEGVVVQSITGHSTARMRDHYSHVDAGEKSAAAGRALRLVHPAPLVLPAPRADGSGEKRGDRGEGSAAKSRAGQGIRTLDFDLGKVRRR